jgi:hypothetical protein
MKELTVCSISAKGLLKSLEQLSHNPEIQNISFIGIDCINWSKFNYKPETHVKLVHFTDGLYLHFKVYESNIKASVLRDNGPVYTDSCVEFFIDPVGDGLYYNFEFNCIGSVLLGFGSSRHGRELASEAILSQIKRLPSIGNYSISEIPGPEWWNLQVFIPFPCFFRHQITNLGSCVRGNFYKCGDLTKTPHYLTWNPVNSITPDFHRPECFGRLKIN